MPMATIRASVRIGAPDSNAARAELTSLGWTTRSETRSTWPLPWIMRTASFSASARDVLEGRPHDEWSRTSRRRSRRRCRGSRSAWSDGPAATAFVAHLSYPPPARTPCHGVTTSSGPRVTRSAASPGETTPSGAGTWTTGPVTPYGRGGEADPGPLVTRSEICQGPRQLVDVPGRFGAFAAPAYELRGQPDERFGHLCQGQDRSPPVGPDAELGGVLVERDQTQIGGPVHDVAAAVVHHEQEPSRQLTQVRVCADEAVESSNHRAQVATPTRDAGQGRGQEVADELVTAGRQQAGALDGLDDGLGKRAVLARQRPQLEVRPAGQVDVAVAVRRGDLRQGRKRLRRQAATREAKADQGAVGGGPGTQRPGTEVATSASGGSVRHAGPSRSGARTRSPRVTSRQLPQGREGLRTRDLLNGIPSQTRRSSGLPETAPALTLTAARQSRSRTGFPAHAEFLARVDWPGRSNPGRRSSCRPRTWRHPGSRVY